MLLGLLELVETMTAGDSELHCCEVTASVQEMLCKCPVKKLHLKTALIFWNIQTFNPEAHLTRSFLPPLLLRGSSVFLENCFLL